MSEILSIDIDRRFCKGCDLCCHVCPREVLERGEERGDLGYIMPIVVHIQACTGCRLCEWACPEMSLVVVENAAD
jgi:NAD-dependent dihydropyrimidine dehydrogenase PreA subunit